MCDITSVESFKSMWTYTITGDEMASIQIIGTIGEFQPENETITAYLERVALFFEVNNITWEKQVSWFLNVMGAKTYSLLRTLVATSQPKEKTTDELMAVLL